MVAAKTCLRKSVSLSSTLFQYVVVPEAAKTIVGLRNMQSELGFYQKPTCVHHDNTGSLERLTG